MTDGPHEPMSTLLVGALLSSMIALALCTISAFLTSLNIVEVWTARLAFGVSTLSWALWTAMFLVEFRNPGGTPTPPQEASKSAGAVVEFRQRKGNGHEGTTGIR